MISFPSLLERSARLNPNGIATRCAGRDRRWPEVIDRVARFAKALQECGIESGDRVAILSMNSDRYLEAIFAIPWAGYTMVPLNTRWAVPENTYALQDSGTRVLLFDDAFTNQAEQLKDAVPGLETLIYTGDGKVPTWAMSYEELIAENQPAEISDRGGEDMVGIFYTGGTTGFPKGVMQSHRALWASAIGCLSAFNMARDSVYLHAAPMFHMADFAGGLGVVLNGATHAFIPGFEPALTLQTISEYEVSHLLIVPAMIKMMLHHPDASTADLSSLKTILYGGSAIPAAVLVQAMELWPQVGFVQAYGQTELAPVVSTLTVEDHIAGGERLKSAGRPTPVSDVRIVDDQDNDCLTGTDGEIVVGGPHTMLGYWNKPEETAAALRDGWVYTGDAGVFDEDGFLYIVDRVKDMIVTGGENVFTTEVENAIVSHPAVQDVAVIGIPHEEWGEAVHAIVVLLEGQSASSVELVAHCKLQIAGYKCAKSIDFRSEPLPLSGAGKVLKTELRKPYWEGRERQVN